MKALLNPLHKTGRRSSESPEEQLWNPVLMHLARCALELPLERELITYLESIARKNWYDRVIPLMKRLSAISLFFFMMLPVFLPLTAFGQDEDANLPVCCRHHGGKHRCSMMMAYLASKLPGTKAIATPVPCPDCPGTMPVSTHFDLGLTAAPAHFAEVSAHPAIHTQTEARARIALDRAWRKRGPPSVVLS
jgi:hypothetical protein